TSISWTDSPASLWTSSLHSKTTATAFSRAASTWPTRRSEAGVRFQHAEHLHEAAKIEVDRSAAGPSHPNRSPGEQTVGDRLRIRVGSGRSQNGTAVTGSPSERSRGSSRGRYLTWRLR